MLVLFGIGSTESPSQISLMGFVAVGCWGSIRRI
nr:MAG TPA: hypothetical protein [Caudoviricetes sp.]